MLKIVSINLFTNFIASFDVTSNEKKSNFSQALFFNVSTDCR